MDFAPFVLVSLLDACHYVCFEGVAFPQQLIHALRIGGRSIGQPLEISRLFFRRR